MTGNIVDAAREGATIAGQFSPVNTGLLTIAIGLLTLLLRHQLANRKLSIGVNGEIRQEMIAQMQALSEDVKSSRDEIMALREENMNLRAEVKGMREENASLRTEVRSLHGVIDGMRRQNLTAQVSGQRVIAETLPHSPAMDCAIETLKGVE